MAVADMMLVGSATVSTDEALAELAELYSRAATRVVGAAYAEKKALAEMQLLGERGSPPSVEEIDRTLEKSNKAIAARVEAELDRAAAWVLLETTHARSVEQ